MKKNEKTQYQYKIIISNYPKETNTSEYVINGDDIIYTEHDEGQAQMFIMLQKKAVFSCHVSRVIECYRTDVIIEQINNEPINFKERLLSDRQKRNNLILITKSTEPVKG